MTAPIRVLHVVGRMNRGGAETWLMNTMRRLDRRNVRFDFLVHLPEPGHFDAEIRELGGRVIPCPDPRVLPRYCRRLAHILRTEGPYDVVHSHVYRFSGIPLLMARLAGVPVRIAHSHTDTRVVELQSGVARWARLAAIRQLLRVSATVGVACSGLAASALFGESWENAGCRLLYCGIDVARFDEPADCSQVRNEFQLPADAELLIHVGRFDFAKNHDLLVEAFATLTRRRQAAYLMLVGAGPLDSAIRERVRELRIEHRVRFCGPRSDVPRLLAAADVFVFPSHYEGLALACIEAQAAGLPLVLSDRIPPEAVVLPDRVTVLPLGRADTWADGIEAALQQGLDRVRGLNAVSATPFDIHRSVAALLALYKGQLGMTKVAA